MDFLATLSVPQIGFNVIPDVFAAYFIYMFRRDKDERKPIVAISFIVLAASSALQIIPLPSNFFFVRNFISLEFYPLAIAALVVLFSEILQLKTFYALLRVFYANLAAILVVVFVPFNLVQVSSPIVDAIGLFALGTSLYLFIKKKQLSNILIFLAILSFLGVGLGKTLDLGLAFIFIVYTFGFIFIGLALSFVPIDDESRVASVLRVTKKLDEATGRLRELKLEYKTVFESANDALFIINPETSLIVDCNVEATKLVGRSKKEIIGKNQKTLFPRPQSGEEFTLPIEEQASGVSKPIETKVVTEKGQIRDVAIKLGAFESSGKKFLVGVFRDITEQKETEQKLRANQQRIELMNEKLRVVGNLTRHDVRNKLSIITAYSYVIKKKHPDQADVVQGLNKMEQATRETEKIFDFAKTYEQLGVEELSEINVEKVVDEAIAMFSLLPFKVINNCKGLTVLADSFLRQLIYNLIDNTSKYGKTTTTVKLYYEKADDGNLLLIYEDDGVGISWKNKPQLFKQGFSTGGSTGFGLFLSKKMMEVYGWTIQETGDPGKGARFVITIPEKNNTGQPNFKMRRLNS